MWAKPELGSGCVKITPAHDFNDYEMGKRHDLDVINVLNDDASINDNAPEAYRGLDRFEARERILADLEVEGLLEKVEDRMVPVGRAQRSTPASDPGHPTSPSRSPGIHRRPWSGSPQGSSPTA